MSIKNTGGKQGPEAPVHRSSVAQRVPGKVVAPPVYRPATSVPKGPAVYCPGAGPPVQRRAALAATAVYRLQGRSGPAAGRYPPGGNRWVIQRAEKPLHQGGVVDVEGLPDEWAPRLLDHIVTLRLWKRTGTTPATYGADTFYSDGDGPLHPLTAEAVNSFWDARYPGFTRTGDPDPFRNCEDYATDGRYPHTAASYNLGLSRDMEALTAALASGTHVLQLGSVRGRAHFLVVEQDAPGFVKIRQKDGDSAIYSRVLSPAEAVSYIKGKHTTVLELRN